MRAYRNHYKLRPKVIIISQSCIGASKHKVRHDGNETKSGRLAHGKPGRTAARAIGSSIGGEAGLSTARGLQEAGELVRRLSRRRRKQGPGSLLGRRGGKARLVQALGQSPRVEGAVGKVVCGWQAECRLQLRGPSRRFRSS